MIDSNPVLAVLKNGASRTRQKKIVSVEKENQITCRTGEPGIQATALPEVRIQQNRDHRVIITQKHRTGLIRRSVVDHDQLNGNALVQNTVDRSAEKGRIIITGDNDRQTRRGWIDK